MKTIKSLTLIPLFLLSDPCLGQGTLQIAFDGPPDVPRGSGRVVQGYFESGFSFTVLPGSDGFVRWGGGGPNRPDNGSAYIQASLGDSLVFANGSLFGVSSVDLAGYSTVVPDFSVDFFGYRSDGSIVSANFPDTGINFRTVFFGPEWSGLTRVEI